MSINRKCIVNCILFRMEYYTAVEMRGPLPDAAAWMNLRIIILS